MAKLGIDRIPRGFPLEEICAHPITAIEGISTQFRDRYHGACGRGCLGCSADAVHPSQATSAIFVLTPQLLRRILCITEDLVRRGFHVFSRERLNLFSGSNELDHPFCMQLRQEISQFLQSSYGFPLGAISSDLVFHVSPSAAFKRNLLQALEQPLLWDNICIAVDEQMPVEDCKGYATYLGNLEWTWKVLAPALRRELDHARAERRASPRVIINVLAPPDGFGFRESYQFLYPGGPSRATSHDELIQRYVTPFVGNLETTGDPIPAEHLFTTSVGKLTGFPGSAVFISLATYELVGRAPSFLNHRPWGSQMRHPEETIRTKLYPRSEGSFVIQACRAANPVSEGELTWAALDMPLWARSLPNFVIHV